MSDEPSLPRLSGVLWDERSQSFSNNPRKRVRPQRPKNAAGSSFTSSDPAVFSSDDDPGLDNYVEGRRKKRYVGSWFQQQPASSDSTLGESQPLPKGKRTLARQFDSGVFLGSDGTDSDSIAESLEISLRPRLPQLVGRLVPRFSKAEHAARERIQACLDKGDEAVMLWSMDLESISNETISPLTQFSCVPLVVKDVAFEQKDPEIKLNLGLNRLTRVPGAIFDITYLTALTLRGNQLTELPPGISKLTNLRELNLSQNRLRHLPVELLDLIESSDRLRTLALHPNPFLQPDSEFDFLLTEFESLLPGPSRYTYESANDGTKFQPRLLSRHCGRSPLQLATSSGRITSTFRIPSQPTTEPVEVEASDDLPASQASSPQRHAVPSKITAVPSLVEVALRACYKSDNLAEMRNYLPVEYVRLHEGLDRAVQQKEQGGIVCSRCRRQIVVPAVEWVEWRQLATCSKAFGFVTLHAHSKLRDERAVPFLHRGCSLRCGPPENFETDWVVRKGRLIATRA